jgi:hypothetical protein
VDHNFIIVDCKFDHFNHDENNMTITVRNSENYGQQLFPVAPLQHFFFSKPPLHFSHFSNFSKPKINLSLLPLITLTLPPFQLHHSSLLLLFPLFSPFLLSKHHLPPPSNPKCDLYTESIIFKPPKTYLDMRNFKYRTLTPIFTVSNLKTSVHNFFRRNLNRPPSIRDTISFKRISSGPRGTSKDAKKQHESSTRAPDPDHEMEEVDLSTISQEQWPENNLPYKGIKWAARATQYRKNFERFQKRKFVPSCYFNVMTMRTLGMYDEIKLFLSEVGL